MIKVEPPAGDTNRTNPPLRGRDGSYFYALSNTDKRGVVLDLRSESGQASLWHLIASADVLVENLKPGSTRPGVRRDRRTRAPPDLVYCSINGFGHDSAYPERPALDTVIQAMSGLMSATRADGVPTKTGSSFSDQIGGQFGLLAVLGALDHRERTGEGATLDLAMHDCTAWATQALWNGAVPQRDTLVAVDDGWVVSGPQLTRSARRERCADNTPRTAAATSRPCCPRPRCWSIRRPGPAIWSRRGVTSRGQRGPSWTRCCGCCRPLRASAGPWRRLVGWTPISLPSWKQRVV